MYLDNFIAIFQVRSNNQEQLEWCRHELDTKNNCDREREAQIKTVLLVRIDCEDRLLA